MTGILRTLKGRQHYGVPLEEWVAAADQVTLSPLDEPHGAQVRPSSLGLTYVEGEYEALADEQFLAWIAEGEQATRTPRGQADGLALQAAAMTLLVAEQEQTVQQATAAYRHASSTLLPYCRREPGTKWRYWLCWLILVLGDMTGVWAAAVMHGEVPVIAFGQALAAGVAAGCSGLIGTELKYRRMARLRAGEAESVTEDEQRYRQLFVGADRGKGTVTVMGALSLLVVALLSVGIFILRASTEGTAAGAMFGLLAAATALASCLLSYASADEVADLLHGYRKRARLAERRYRRLAAAPVIRRQAQAAASARSLQAEHQARGLAAMARIDALSWRIQRNNAPVLGHGLAATDAGGVIGRRRRDGAA